MLSLPVTQSPWLVQACSRIAHASQQSCARFYSCSAVCEMSLTGVLAGLIHVGPCQPAFNNVTPAYKAFVSEQEQLVLETCLALQSFVNVSTGARSGHCDTNP